MTINDLFKAFTDLEYQSNRLLKSKKMDLNWLEHFDVRCEEVREQIIRLDISKVLNESMQNLQGINLDFSPDWNFGHTLTNIICLGLYKKRYIAKQREIYFRQAIDDRKKLFHFAESELKES